MSATWTIKRARLLAAGAGVLGAWACTVADKGDYTFTDNPGTGGSSGKGTGGSSTAGKGGTGEAGVPETGGTSGLGGRGGRGGAGAMGGRGGKAGEAGQAGEAGEGGAAAAGGTGGTSGNAGEAGESGAGGEAGMVPMATCGDGHVDSGEQCDLGANNGVTACAYGQRSCTVCTTACKRAAGTATYCGDGKTQASHEECDPGTAAQSCDYGDSTCSGCGSDCKRLAAYCGDGTLNGPKLTSVKLEYQGLWDYCGSVSSGLSMPFSINGVPVPNAPQGPCDCGSPQDIVSVVTTDSTVLKAVRPNANLVELFGVTSSDLTLVPWVRLTFSFDSVPDVVITPFDPHGQAGGTDPCWLNGDYNNVIYTEGYISGTFGGLPVEMCDGSSNCTSCQTSLPATCADILRANSSATDGPYRIDPTGGDSADALTAYCDMTDGGISYESLAFGQSGVSYSGYTQVEDGEIQNPRAQQALLWLYDMQGGIINLNPGWQGSNCAYRTTSYWIQAGGSYFVPGDLESTTVPHCDGPPYSEPLMKLALYTTQTVQTPPLTLDYFTTNPITLESAGSSDASPSFFFKKQ